jgi:NAD(P)-dependent dehydrogenase (short-subunit alcohol dehydrogenase family)
LRQPWFQIAVEQIEEAALVVPGSVEDQMVEAVLDVFASLFDGLVGVEGHDPAFGDLLDGQGIGGLLHLDRIIDGVLRRRCPPNATKAAVSMLTVKYANAFLDAAELSHVKINAITPGYVATDLNNFRGVRSTEEGARASV